MFDPLPGKSMTQAPADIEAAAASASTALKATLAGAGTLSIGGLTANDLAIAVGAVVGVLGLLMQWVYRRREYRLRLAEHAATMRRLGAEPLRE